MKFRSWCPILGEDKPVGLEREWIDGIYCPHCYPDCSFTRYTYTSSFVDLMGLPHGFESNTTDYRHSTIVKVYFAKQHTNLYYIDLVYTWQEMLSVFGSLLSMFFGFSIMSLLEVFYFGIWRTFQYYKGLIPHETTHKIDLCDYKSVEREFLRISMRKNLFPLPTQYRYLRKIQSRKPINRLNF